MLYRELIKYFDNLNTSELYEIMKIRQDVFVVEQNCAYLDADNKDQQAFHLMLLSSDNKIVAYTRLLPEGVSYPGYVSIGRVLSIPEVRGSGMGKTVMIASIDACAKLFGKKNPIKIGAQSYLIKFYESLGFDVAGEEYLEDGIPHVHMIRQWL